MKQKILLIEDNFNLSENIEEVLTIHGFEITAILNQAETALDEIREKEPNLILVDIKLKGAKNGIELAEEIRKIVDTPIVFLTSSAGKEIINKVGHINPDGFITKPFSMEGLITSIELAFSNHKTKNENKSHERIIQRSTPSELFIRENGWLRRIVIAEIDWIKAEGTYTQINLNRRQYTLRNTVKELMKKLPEEFFLRVHKSYIVNIRNVEALNSNIIKINEEEIPVGKIYYQELLKKINKVTN
ncbi:MAG: response regulator transcription factor [Flavobacterium sp.]|nr:response regulator transcription factor [Flavobacterium sp.]